MRFLGSKPPRRRESTKTEKSLTQNLAESVRHTTSGSHEGLEGFGFDAEGKPKLQKPASKPKKPASKTKTKKKLTKTVTLRSKPLWGQFIPPAPRPKTLTRKPPKKEGVPEVEVAQGVIEPTPILGEAEFLGWKMRAGFPYGQDYGVVVTVNQGTGDEMQEFEISQDDPNGDLMRTLGLYEELVIAAAVSFYRKQIATKETE